VVCVVVAGSVVVSVVVVLVCANASGVTSAQAKASIVLFIYASLFVVLIVRPERRARRLDGLPLDYIFPFSLGRLQAARIHERFSV
jgi:hypothetical protein